MVEARVSNAIARIETALSRVQKAAADLQAQATAAHEADERYERLRATVRERLDELDTLIARLEQ